jgi:general secretion pathway protein D
MTRDEARRRDVEIKMGNNPSSIPKDSAVVTQIVPVRSLNATQLSKDLAPLLPTDTSMIPNEAGNALIITDTQTVIHRVAELVRALDAAGSSANSIKTYTLKYADAKSLVSIIKELFPSSSSSSSGNQGGGFGRMNPMAFFGGPGRNSGSSDSSSQKASTRVSVVSDDNSNMLVVSAPDDIIPIITDLVSSLDVQTEDQAELKLFHLKYSDPTEMAELLTSLFPDDTSSNSSGNNRNSGPFGFFGGPPGMGGRSSSSSSTSDRLKRKNKVIAVADARTASVAVTADKTIMEQIDQLIAQLDSNPAKKMKVYVYSLQNADVTDVETVLNDLFYSSNSRSTSSSSYNSTSDALSTRKSSMIQQQSTTTSSFGSSSSSSQ